MSEPPPLPSAPAALRNREPILRVLESRIGRGARVLEVASGTGQHASFLAPRLGVHWQPSERDPELLATIVARAEREGGGFVDPPVVLDAERDDWPVGGPFDALFNANLIHIAPFEVAQGLLRGAARHLRAGGALFLYGPFFVEGVPTAPSNLAFDRSLRERDPRFGVRDLERVRETAAASGLALVERVPMPANNCLVHFERSRS